MTIKQDSEILSNEQQNASENDNVEEMREHAERMNLDENEQERLEAERKIAEVREQEEKKRREQEERQRQEEEEEWERNATILAFHAYNNLLAKIEREINSAVDYAEQIDALDWIHLNSKNQSREKLEKVWETRRMKLVMKKLQFESTTSSGASSKSDFPIIWIAGVVGVGILSAFAYRVIKWNWRRSKN